MSAYFRIGVADDELAHSLDDTDAIKRFVRVWRASGILVHGSKVQRLVRAKSLDQDGIPHGPGRVFGEAWKSARKLFDDGVDALCDQVSQSQLAAMDTTVELACLPGKSIDRLVAVASGSGRAPKCELTTLGRVDVSRSYELACDSASAILQKGTMVDDLWRRWFDALASSSRVITAHDRYCLVNHFSVHPRANFERSGLRNLLRLLARPRGHKDPRELVVYTCPNTKNLDKETKPISPEVLVSAARDLVALARRKFSINLRIVLCDKQDKLRWLRFDATGFDLSHGLRCLEGPYLGYECHVSPRDVSPMLAAEARLNQAYDPAPRQDHQLA